MNADELKDTMALAGEAFADGLATNEERRREQEEARVVAEARSYALGKVSDFLTLERRTNRHKVVSAVGTYCSKAREDVLDKLKNDKRMPRSINYLERYNALLGMDNRAEVLRRLDQTIAKAECIIDEVGEVDVDSALTEAAQTYADRVRLLDGIVVCDAEEQVADRTEEVPLSLLATRIESDEQLHRAIDNAFDRAFDSQTDAEAELLAQIANRNERMEKLKQQVVDAAVYAEEEVKATMRVDAQSVAGNVLSLPTFPEFEGGTALSAELDVDELRELAVEVRKSFRTFRQVVQDNGLFAAFASEGSFGACSGWRFGFWWDDFLYDMSEYEGEIPGHNKVRDIATVVEEDEGGDSLQKSIERMRGFNKKRYWGMLDDDFDEHVEAFWYGFKKLMEGVNGLYRMNPATFNQYCNDIAEDVKQATLDVGAGYMDAHQAAEFVKEVEKRAKAWKSD